MSLIWDFLNLTSFFGHLHLNRHLNHGGDCYDDDDDDDTFYLHHLHLSYDDDDGVYDLERKEGNYDVFDDYVLEIFMIDFQLLNLLNFYHHDSSDALEIKISSFMLIFSSDRKTG